MVEIPGAGGGWKSLMLEHLQTCLGCDPTRYNRMKKSENMAVSLRKLVENGFGSG
jgi:hypothetical protein